MCHSSTRPGTSYHVTQLYQDFPRVSTASDKHWARRPGYEATTTVSIGANSCWKSHGTYQEFPYLWSYLAMTLTGIADRMFSYVVFILISTHFCITRSFLATTDDPLGPLDSVLLMTIWTWCSCSAITISLLVPCAGNQDGESKLKIALGFCNKCLKQPSWDVRWKYLQGYATDSPTNYQCARVAEQGNRTLKEAARSGAVRSLFTNVAA